MKKTKSNPSYLKSKFAHFDTLKKLCKNGFEVYVGNYRNRIDCKYEEQLQKAMLNSETFFTSDLFRYTDYGGAYTIAKANIKYIEEEYPDLVGEQITIYGTQYNGENCEFSLDVLSNQKLVEELLGLDSYPLLSDDTLSEVEHEIEGECWKAYGHDMWKDALKKEYGEESIDKLSDEEIDELACEAAQHTSEGFGHVEAMEFSFDIKGMLEAVKKDLKGSKLKKSNPCDICANPEWASDEVIWDEAKKKSLKEYGKISYPFVVYLYKQLGGKVKKIKNKK